MLKLKVFFLLISIPMMVFANPIFAEEPEEVKEEVECESKEDVLHRHKSIQTHIQFYYELLIDKYKPELKEEWK
ncbi:hypothetical protein, partial [Pseudomonas sp. 2822-17]|uniref:hypothetical protein n=1 Tax=Pseudomonas sp. 2822-17 TaxID=1712678 RepID=UPI000C6A182D